MELNGDDVIQILKIVEESRFSELSLQINDLKIIVRKSKAQASQKEICPDETASSFAEKVNISLLPPERSCDLPMTPAGAEPQPCFENDGTVPVRAPVLGAFYRAHKPGAKPFVEVGQLVAEDDTVCIIEVMKLFTTVKAGLKGRIVKILAQDGQLVEFNQPLFFVKQEEPGEGKGRKE